MSFSRAGYYHEVLIERTEFTTRISALLDAQVRVYSNSALTIPATLYNNRTKGGTVTQPIAPDSHSNVSFYADPGPYWIEVKRGDDVLGVFRVTVTVDEGDVVSAADLSSHASTATNVHGIADTSTLATQSYASGVAAGEVNDHEAASNPHPEYPSHIGAAHHTLPVVSGSGWEFWNRDEFKGEKGDKGDKGDPGEDGEDGDTQFPLTDDVPLLAYDYEGILDGEVTFTAVSDYHGAPAFVISSELDGGFFGQFDIFTGQQGVGFRHELGDDLYEILVGHTGPLPFDNKYIGFRAESGTEATTLSADPGFVQLVSVRPEGETFVTVGGGIHLSTDFDSIWLSRGDVAFDNVVSSPDILRIVKLTQDDYDNLSTPRDPAIMYVIDDSISRIYLGDHLFMES